MKIYMALLLFGIALFILIWGTRIWWKDKESRQNRVFLCMSIAAFLWAGSLAVMFFCPQRHTIYYATISSWGSHMFCVYVYLFFLTFYKEDLFYRIVRVAAPLLATGLCYARYYNGALVIVPTDYGYYYIDKMCVTNYLSYGFLFLLCTMGVITLFRHRARAQLMRERFCLTVWIILIISFTFAMVGTTFYNMLRYIPTTPYEGFGGCAAALLFYLIADYLDVIDIPSKNVRVYITEHLNLPVVFVDHVGRITYCNEAYKELFGLHGNVVGTDNFYPNLQLEKSLDEAIEYVREEKIERGSFKARTLDGKRALDIHFSLLLDKFGETRAVINLITDVTDTEKLLENLEEQKSFAQKQMEIAEEQTAIAEEQSALAEENRKAAVRANEAKSEFLANMSHEIRTPLNAILGMNEMIMNEEISPTAMQYSQDIFNAGQTLLAIINDILDFSKIESGKMEIVPVTYELSSVLNDVINMVTRKIEDKRLKLFTDVATDIPSQLFGDEVRIRQILLNIVNNAVKYTREGSVTIKVDWDHLDDVKIYLRISVTDTGIGIRKEDQEKLFKGFQRVDMVNNRNIEGTGLGLAITKRLVEQMDGLIAVKSVYGEGSTFTVILPQVVMNDEPMGDFVSAYQRMKHNNVQKRDEFTAPDARVLIVDDNRVNLTVAKGLLKGTQAQVDTAESGLQALDMIRTNKYHIIFLDHMMPELNGIETIKRMRMQEENMSRDAAVIALTANAVSGSREMYMVSGFTDYLSKPIDVVRYLELLRRYIPEEMIKEKE